MMDIPKSPYQIVAIGRPFNIDIVCNMQYYCIQRGV